MPPPGASPYGYGPPAPASSSAGWALGLAIASWVLCGCFASLPALFLARSELSAIDRGESSPAGRSTAQAAFWIAAVNVGLSLLGLGIYALAIGLAVVR